MSFKSIDQIPGNKSLGEMLRLHRRRLQFGEVMQELSRRYGDIVRLPVPGTTKILLSHPEDVQDVLAAKSQYFSLFGQNLFRDFFPWGLIATEGQIHDENRALMLMAMRKMQSRFDVHKSLARCRYVTSEFQDGQVIDLYQVARDLTFATAVDFLFPPDLGSQLLAGLHHEEFLQVLSRTNCYFLALPEPLKLVCLLATMLATVKVTRLQKRIRRQLQAMLAGYSPDPSLAPFRDVLSLLVDGSEIGGRMDESFLVDNLIALLLAGYETTANTVAWAFWEAARQSTLQDSIADEGRLLAANPEDCPNWINQALWTDAALRESERLYPSVWVLARQTTADYQIRGFMLPKGTPVYVSQWVTHRDPRWFPDAETFSASRWIEERHRPTTASTPPGASVQRPGFSFFPFGGGKRFCIGKSVFELEASVLLASILAEWKITPLPGVQVRPRFYVTMQPDSPMKVQFQRR